MRLLIQSLNYAPDEIGIAKYSAEMAEWFARRSWEVAVITAPPYYPAWRVTKGYRSYSYSREMRNQVCVLRCPLYVPRQPSGMKRLLHLATFAVSSAPAMYLEARRFKPDAIIAVAPALMAAPFSAFVARSTHTVSLLHVQDFELDVALQVGLLDPKGYMDLLSSIERFILGCFDGVSAPSLNMVEKLAEKGVACNCAFPFRNWCDTEVIRPNVKNSRYRQEWDVHEYDLVILYSGTLSEKQGILTIADLARSLMHYKHVQFVVCGDGPARGKLENATRDLSNVRILPLQPSSQLPELLCSADIHLLPQVKEAADLVLPSKLSGMLASGRPVIATVLPNSGIADEIGDGGIIVPPGDVDALCEAILWLAARPERRYQMGRAARNQAVARWSKEAILSNFEDRLKALIIAKTSQRQ